MTRTTRLISRLVDEVPEHLAPGVLYVADSFKTAMHLCCCGCGGEVTTRYGAGGWSLSLEPAGPTIVPSIGPATQKCRSHYVVTRGEVFWLDNMTDGEIALSRQRDAQKRAIEFAAEARAKAPWYIRFLRWIGLLR